MEQFIVSMLQTLIQQSPLAAVLGVLAHILWKANRASEARNEQWINIVIKDKNEQLTESRKATRDCSEKHEATRAKLDRLMITLAKVPGIDVAALRSAPPKRPHYDDENPMDKGDVFR